VLILRATARCIPSDDYFGFGFGFGLPLLHHALSASVCLGRRAQEAPRTSQSFVCSTVTMEENQQRVIHCQKPDSI
jgi:hypothetical protein